MVYDISFLKGPYAKAAMIERSNVVKMLVERATKTIRFSRHDGNLIFHSITMGHTTRIMSLNTSAEFESK